MTEAAWLTSDDPKAMRRTLVGIDGDDFNRRCIDYDRKLRLFCCACHRAFHPPGSYDAGYLEVERADGNSDNWPSGVDSLSSRWCDRAGEAKGENDPQTRENTAALLREVFGNPFRPANFPVECQRCGKINGERWVQASGEILCTEGSVFVAAQCRGTVSCPWFTPTVLSLVQYVSEERDFAGLPVLADALEEAGCQEEVILRHLRSEVSHVRGCWVVDLLLGKELSMPAVSEAQRRLLYAKFGSAWVHEHGTRGRG